jgi:hypothetical protein
MKRVIIVSKEMSNDLDQMQKLVKLAGKQGGCEACCSGDPLEFHIEEMAMSSKQEEVFRVDSKTGNLIRVEKGY